MKIQFPSIFTFEDEDGVRSCSPSIQLLQSGCETCKTVLTLPFT